MASPVARAEAALERARERWPMLDHAVRTQQHYGTVNGSGLAGSVTYFAFLAFFPILALAFFVVGYLSKVYPDASDNLVKAVGTLLPNIIGSGDGEIRLGTIQNAAGRPGCWELSACSTPVSAGCPACAPRSRSSSRCRRASSRASSSARSATSPRWRSSG